MASGRAAMTEGDNMGNTIDILKIQARRLAALINTLEAVESDPELKRLLVESIAPQGAPVTPVTEVTAPPPSATLAPVATPAPRKDTTGYHRPNLGTQMCVLRWLHTGTATTDAITRATGRSHKLVRQALDSLVDYEAVAENPRDTFALTPDGTLLSKWAVAHPDAVALPAAWRYRICGHTAFADIPVTARRRDV